MSDSEPTGGILNRTPSPPPTVLRAISLKPPSPILLRAVSLRISSPSENSFILRIRFPGETTYINALIDSGASVNFIDLALASKYPSLHCLLQLPIDLELFDGELTSGGTITHDLTTPILYPNGVQHTVTFHETKLHRSNPIVLGLKWLKDVNPDVDWTSLSLVFRKERLAGAIPMLRPGKSYKTTIEEVPDEDSPTHPPQEGPLFPPSDKASTRETFPNDEPIPTSPPKPPPKPSPDDTRKDQQCPAPKDSPLNDAFPTPTDTPWNHKIDIKIIGAAPFARLIRDGIEVYQLHISPVSPHETLRAEKTQDSEKKTEQEILEEVVPPEYHDFANVFSEGEAKSLPPHRPYDHKIDLEEGTEPPFGKIYNMSETELKLLKDYLDDMLGKGFI